MKFSKDFYHFQNEILNKFESEVKRGDKKIHIVAPPGSGKTIVGLEMVTRIDGNSLILVPNITLQYQWKDKLAQMFIEKGENIEDIVSTDVSIVKKINIITYQALTQTGEGDDLIMAKILESWFQDVKGEFKDYKEFEIFLDNLKTDNIDDYAKTLAKYRKKQKNINNVEKLLTQKVFDYFEKLKTAGIDVIVVDEAHHLTNWWSSVIFYLRNYLGNRFIIGLTATPPFENTDFFILDDDYTNLLGEVDYYVPQPAIVKSGKLAPYQDLVYFVEPDNILKETLLKFEMELKEFLKNHNKDICDSVYKYVKTNFDKLIKEKTNILNNYLRFLYNYSDKDLTDYIFGEEIGEKVEIEDIAKTVGKYISSEKIKSNKDFAEVKKLFYNLGYIWRGANFYRFRTPIEMQLIYSKAKISGIETILDEEIKTLGYNMKCAIITDFLDENENNYINCKYILESLKLKYKVLNPILVSGQGNYIIGTNGEAELIQDTILDITRKLSSGETKLLIGTRGILGEGWDCPKLNTLIDLTGIVAYMSVNQTRGRAIRLDLDNLKKVSNIYDIVCLGQGFKGDIDLQRLVSKHDKFYGIDDSGLIIKGVNHIYPDLKNNSSDYEKVNKNMIKRIQLRDYIYDLWGINGEFSNKEIFGLNLHIDNYGQILPLFRLNLFDKIRLYKCLRDREKMNEIEGENYYNTLIIKYLNRYIKACTKTMKFNKILPTDFKYKIIISQSNDIKIISNYRDEIIIKSFITYISKIFSIISNQKYALELPFVTYNGESLEQKYISFGLGDELCKNKEFRDLLAKNLISSFGNSFNTIIVIFTTLAIYFTILSSINIFSVDLQFKIFGLFILAIIIILFGTQIIILSRPLFNKIGIINKYLTYMKYQKEFLKLKYWGEKNIIITYINGDKIKKADYIGKKPFITSKIEKLWI